MTSSESRRVQPRRQERRRNPRWSIAPLIYLKVPPGNGGLLLDLSEAGMCVSLANPLAISEVVRFSFSLPDAPIIEGVGRSCWVSESGKKAGVVFVECPDESLHQIKQWLRNEAMGPGEADARQDSRGVAPWVASSRDYSPDDKASRRNLNERQAAERRVEREDAVRRMFPSDEQGASSARTLSGPIPDRQDSTAFAEPPVETQSPTSGNVVAWDTPLFFLPCKAERRSEETAPDRVAARPFFSSGENVPPDSPKPVAFGSRKEGLTLIGGRKDP